MSVIKRFEPYIVDTREDDPTHGALKQARMCEVADGDYVRFADHEAALKAVKADPSSAITENVVTGNTCFESDS